ncbi:hypothetical protein [Delftia sp. PS-11]|uniref:hypothetical protein n=1 Tax=Delftia sp. PS-11 TaxID=2767222 RepID=UPI00245D6E2E|nr:hypothetical protein H9T68_06510 [Delftia sp. PS-11]
MDTRTQIRTAGPAVQAASAQWTPDELGRIEVGQQIIKTRMLGVYAHIQKKAAADRRIWGLVRQGLAGRPGCFWAVEGSQAVGTPFVAWASVGRIADLLQQMAQPEFVCMLGPLDSRS